MSRARAVVSKRDFARHVGAVRTRIGKRLGPRCSKDEIDDLVQQTMALGLASAAKLVEPKALRPWLLTIAARSVYDHIATRSERRRECSLDTAIEGVVAKGTRPEQAAESLEFWQIIADAIDALPADVREVGRLRFLVGESLAAIARAVNRSKSTVQGHIKQARTALATRLTGTGHAAFVPLLDVVASEPLVPAAPVWDPSIVARRGALVSIAAVATIVLGIAAYGQITNTMPPAQAATSNGAPSQAQITSTARSVPQPNTAPLRSDALARHVIRGRVVDGATGAPLPAARVFAFDYLDQNDYGLLTDTNGEFCIEASRGTRRPFELYVKPPAGRGLARAIVGARVAAATPIDVRVEAGVTIELSMFSSREQADYIAGDPIDVAVVTLSERELFWPNREGAALRQIRPSHHSILARRSITGAIRDIEFRDLPRSRLGFVFATPDGRIHFGQTNAGASRRDTSEQEHRTRGSSIPIRLAASGLTMACPPPLAVDGIRRSQEGARGPISMIARPRLVNEFGCQMLNHDNSAIGPEPRTSESGPEARKPLDGLVSMLDGRFSRNALPSNGRSVAATIDIQAIRKHAGWRKHEEAVVVVKGLDEVETHYGIRAVTARDQPEILNAIPTDRPLRIEVMSADFERVIWSACLAIPIDQQAPIRIPTGLSAVDVSVTERTAPVIDAELHLILPNSRNKQVESQPSRVNIAGTGKAHTPLFATKCEVQVSHKTKVGATTLVESVEVVGDKQLTYDVDVGVHLRVRDGGDWLKLAANQGCSVAAKVEGVRSLRVARTIELCDDGRITVPTGVRGLVQGTIWLGRPPGHPGQTRFLAFVAQADSLAESKAIVELATTNSIGDSKVTTIRLVDDTGAAIAPTPKTTIVEIAFPTWPSAAANPAVYWMKVPWDATDNELRIETPSDPRSLLRVSVRDRTPEVATAPPSTAGNPIALTLRLRPATAVVVHDGTLKYQTTDGDPIGWGLSNGDTIAAIAGQRVTTQTQVKAALAAADPSHTLRFEIHRAGESQFLDVPAPWQSFTEMLRFSCR